MTDPAATAPYVPLAARMRPRRPEDFFGQEHLLGPDKQLSNAIRSGVVHCTSRAFRRCSPA